MCYNQLFRSIALVPLDEVETAWDELVEQVDERLQPVISWFEKSYIGESFVELITLLFLGRFLPRSQTRTNPTFPPQLWNVHEQTKKGLFLRCFASLSYLVFR